MADINKQIQAARSRVPHLDHQALITLRQNALRFGDQAAELIADIDVVLAEFSSSGGMSPHRLEFARCILRSIYRFPALQWVAGRDLYQKALIEHADNQYVIWLKGNGARAIPLTKALEDALPEFQDIERRKDGAAHSDRVYFRHR
jgi:hypothetical protein